MTLEAFRVHALEGDPDAWIRPTFLRTRIDHDRLDGEIDHIQERKRSLANDEARRLASVAQDGYAHACTGRSGQEADRSLEVGPTRSSRSVLS